MHIVETEIKGIVIIEPTVFSDERGYFFESFSQKEFEQKVSKTVFVQDNESRSRYGVVRGLHFQRPPYEQAKLVRVVKGKVLDVVVDIRKESPTYGQHVATELSEDNKRSLFIPHGFAHGYATLSEEAVFQYKCDHYYMPDYEGAILWNDPKLGIDWLLSPEDIILSEKDRRNPLFSVKS
ncbi:dTDP-4-dehydrorhamnose 3,5-epimerase [Proteiniphilum sp.]|uniref:dTDP-4-dehydrorhamnose 3,5-epimerase n=1 Tax=Proteiniphilum sp. TaxID=1926877 RepID=UPI0033212574